MASKKKLDKDLPERMKGKIEMDVRFLSRYPGLVKKLAEEYEVDEQEVVQALGHYFVALKDCITDWRMPAIKIPEVGTFAPTLGKLNWYIKRCIYNYRLGYITKKQVDDRIKSVWPIRERLKEEKTFTLQTTAQEATWYRWRDYGYVYKPEIFKKEKTN